MRGEGTAAGGYRRGAAAGAPGAGGVANAVGAEALHMGQEEVCSAACPVPARLPSLRTLKQRAVVFFLTSQGVSTGPRIEAPQTNKLSSESGEALQPSGGSTCREKRGAPGGEGGASAQAGCRGRSSGAALVRATQGRRGADSPAAELLLHVALRRHFCTHLDGLH